MNMLRTQYRQPIDWTDQGMEESTTILDNFYRAVGDVEASEPTSDFIDAMKDDMNTPKAIAVLHELRASGKAPELKACANILGLLERTEAEWIAATRDTGSVDADQVEAMIAARNAARAEKNFAEADRLRDELDAMGVALKDGADGTSWEIKR